MKKIFITILVLAFSLSFSGFLPASAKAASPNIAGKWVLVINYNGDVQVHDMMISSQDQSGYLSGTGGYPRGEAYSITWNLDNSQIKGNDIRLSIVYNNSDFIAKLDGKVQPNGTISGKWSDNRGLSGTWGAAPTQD